MSIQEIAGVIGGRIHLISPELSVSSYPIIDSREARKGTAFFALPGSKRDGNDFAEDAINVGSDFAVTSREMPLPSIIVGDVAYALKQLALFARRKMDSTTFIGITGSQGKTTTKELLKYILSIDGETVAPVGSFNNEIGVPLTLLRCTDSTKYCILEMGARHSGDISELATLGKPTIGVLLNIGSAHVGEFGGRAELAKAKSELIYSLPDSGVAILGTYDEFTPAIASERFGLSRVLFGEKSSCDVRAADIEFREGRAHFDLVTPEGRASVSLQLLGAHQISNALAAAAVGTALGLNIDSIAAALSTAEPSSKWRMELQEIGPSREILLINDSYNANPESMSAALRTLVLLAQERGGSAWAILGKMHELGEEERDAHSQIVEMASNLGVDHFLSIENDLYSASQGYGGMTFHSISRVDIDAELAAQFHAGDTILVKASRAEHLEEIAEKLSDLLLPAGMAGSENDGEGQ